MRKLSLFIACLFAAGFASAKSFSLSLNRGWEFREAGQSTWLPATVPGTVHTDLMRAGRIPDPFYRDNEQKVQWVSQRDWEYRSTFLVSKESLSHKHVELLFEGLDTYADIWLNGQLVLSADNMFRTWRVDAKPFIHAGKNELRVLFHSAERLTDSLAMHILPLQLPGENNRAYARKAQYHFGWDWAPRMITAGIWRSVWLKGYDEPPVETDAWKKSLHHVVLVQDRDSIGRSFYFKIDEKPTFMKGANWIPADVFLPRVTKTKYRSLLLAAKEAHCNMLRVWGGGIYEDDAFYDLCDSLGILVWQDFMFAGAMYPGDAHFMENVRQEAIDNIIRLRRHKCIVLWCGNNEIDEAWHNWGWQKQFHLSNDDSAKLWKDYIRLPLAVERATERVLLIPITSDRGLAGAYNSNVIKLTREAIREKYSAQDAKGNVTILPLGKKGYEYFTRYNFKVVDKFWTVFSDLSFDAVREAAVWAQEAFLRGEFDRVELVYSQFRNAATQAFVLEPFLPIPRIAKGESKRQTDFIFEPDKETLLLELMPKILNTQVYKAVLDANASEHGARMTAMDKASENAAELLRSLKISYNRARQAAITTELTEIVSGAAALQGA